MNELTRHHIFSPKRDYSTQLERRFRCQSGLIIPGVHLMVHKQLHYEVPHPPKPTKREMVDIFDRLGHVPNEQRQEPYWGVLNVIDYYSGIQGERAFMGRLIAKNLIQQLCVLELGRQEAA
jgi:hypothetical protein